ncbi:hypothetical protein AXF42_Ash016891 [Apostasia shenzhenica]|uniref:Uncharacterized protein n=1 Tax=Apostasia shenzhenica TaxID=1088818 RepID=A0A2H9ZRE2_9ASPA|nr:hypothetical protein AXF42_Ash016891 [Apostasia shenzhenica]
MMEEGGGASALRHPPLTTAIQIICSVLAHGAEDDVIRATVSVSGEVQDNDAGDAEFPCPSTISLIFLSYNTIQLSGIAQTFHSHNLRQME